MKRMLIALIPCAGLATWTGCDETLMNGLPSEVSAAVAQYAGDLSTAKPIVQQDQDQIQLRLHLMDGSGDGNQYGGSNGSGGGGSGDGDGDQTQDRLRDGSCGDGG
ncbi:MAG: hypothetical protein HZB38_14430 [Planctomycetes bacterium]|nr:hypothetical protein [Planctomycetota bacterium]